MAENCRITTAIIKSLPNYFSKGAYVYGNYMIRL